MDAINPKHYKEEYPFEVIDLIRLSTTRDQFIGYCLGNEIKYRMRAGLKSDNVEEDIRKAMWYHDVRKRTEIDY